MERISFRNITGDKFLNLDLNMNFSVFGVQEDLDKYVKYKQNSLINPITDSEFSRFKYNGVDNKIFRVNFKGVDESFGTSILNAFFTLDEINSQDKAFTDSYFIFDYFDSMDKNNQTLLSTVYLKPMVKKFKTYSSTTESVDSYKIVSFDSFFTFTTSNTTWNEFNYFNIPNNYISINQSADTFYLKISFYNTKLGGRTFFHTNSTSTTNPTNFDFYFKVLTDNKKMSYYFENNSFYNNIFEFKNLKFIQKDRENNSPNISNNDNRTLILGSGDII